MVELPKRYDPKTVEQKWYKYWEEKNYFRAEVDNKRKPFCIVIPPPNITGSLHMGHALNNALQDIMVRWKRMSGTNVLWIPGVDHAGIATQNVVEKVLSKEGITRQQLGRGKFIKRVWEWKAEYGDTIVKQLKHLGSSCDWTRQRFTMDEGCSRAVREEFALLYQEGLIYRACYIINWCPRCHTALSDIEVEHKEVAGKLYYIKYLVKGDQKQSITVATTRPETMLGDTALAVHPDDKRYRTLIGEIVILPLVERELRVIAERQVDPSFGTGAVKITPAHDPVDFEIGQKHKLTQVVIMDEEAQMTENTGKYAAMDRFQCRQAILADLRQQGYLEKVVDYSHAVGHCYRCNTMVEPRLSDQWFVKMKPLIQPAIKAVKDKKIRFVPERWTGVYLNWMENIKDWCISRQIWWGHRIPVWYCKKCGELNVSREDISNCEKCQSTDIEQDPDVLDTWFSSALWPFSTLGWPKENSELSHFYPTSVLVTAYDIIYFWVARMIMMGIKLTGKVPFHTVYIHGLVRDREGKKMSKSLGNIINPLTVMDKYGTDAFRFTLAQLATLGGQDVLLAEERLEGNRNFANKLWNAARFILMNTAGFSPSKIKHEGLSFTDDDRYIIGCLNQVIAQVTEYLSLYRFNEAARAIYEFVWHEFCDWYLELSKLRLPRSGKPIVPEREETTVKWVLFHVLENSIKLLHPFMPFITEEIWQQMGGGSSIMITDWPSADDHKIDLKLINLTRRKYDVIKAERRIRSFWHIPTHQPADHIIKPVDEEENNMLQRVSSQLLQMVSSKHLVIDRDHQPSGHIFSEVTPSGTAVYMKIGENIDLEAERERLTRELHKVDLELKRVSKKLASKEFLKKAPPEVVKKDRKKEEEHQIKREKLINNLEMLK